MVTRNGLNANMYSYYKNKGIYGKSQFGEILSVSRTPIIELNSSYGTSALRDDETTAGTGSITSTDGEIVLSTGTTASSRAMLETAEIGRYVPGFGAELGIGIRIPTLPDGNKRATWGGMDDDASNGIYFGYDSGGFYVARLRDSTETKVYSSAFNIDKLDGNGISGYTLDFTKGNIFQIDFTWYGYGQILFGVMGVVDNQQFFLPCHAMSNADFSNTSVLTPNLRVFAETKNNGDAEDLTAYVGGRQYAIVGEYIPKYRFASEFRGTTNTSTTVIPLISYRRKSGFSDRSIKLQSFDVKAVTEDLYVEIIIGGSLTGESFGTPTDYTAAETAVEADKAATAITGGTVVWGQLILAGQNQPRGQLATADVDFDLPNGDIVSLCVRTLSSTGTCRSAFRLREEW